MTDKTKSPKVILLVDDDPLITRMYQLGLAQYGYRVETAADGAEAIGMVAKKRPDLILLDVMMPKMNGVETLKALKRDDDTRSIPVIILTNLGDKPEDVENAKKLGALEYLVKSGTTPKILAEKVAAALGR